MLQAQGEGGNPFLGWNKQDQLKISQSSFIISIMLSKSTMLASIYKVQRICTRIISVLKFQRKI